MSKLEIGVIGAIIAGLLFSIQLLTSWQKPKGDEKRIGHQSHISIVNVPELHQQLVLIENSAGGVIAFPIPAQ